MQKWLNVMMMMSSRDVEVNQVIEDNNDTNNDHKSNNDKELLTRFLDQGDNDKEDEKSKF
jgi:hypothetical protein